MKVLLLTQIKFNFSLKHKMLTSSKREILPTLKYALTLTWLGGSLICRDALRKEKGALGTRINYVRKSGLGSPFKDGAALKAFCLLSSLLIAKLSCFIYSSYTGPRLFQVANRLNNCLDVLNQCHLLNSILCQ